MPAPDRLRRDATRSRDIWTSQIVHISGPKTAEPIVTMTSSADINGAAVADAAGIVRACR